ncbi:hypothetical protein C8R42DRAFT_134359 [Lentinula raphanica]|nr:hypothetical protein C8R42DRAFT_134359 [Lentinula raphanica]
MLSFFHQSTQSSHDGANARQAGQGQNPSSSSQHGVNGEPLHDRSSEEERLSSPEQQANRFLDNLANELSNRPDCPPPGPSALEANRLQQLEGSTTQNPTRLMLTGDGDHARGVQTADHSSDDLPGATSAFQSDQVPQQATHPRSNHHQRRASSGERASYDDFWNGYDDEVRDLEEAPPSYPDSQARQRRLEEEARQRKEREAAEKKRQEEAQAGQASGSQGARKLSRSGNAKSYSKIFLSFRNPPRESFENGR